MLDLIAFCILFLMCSTSASGAAKLIYITIQDGELFGKWQRVIAKIEPEKGDKNYFIREFWYKRFGGCIICMRQFIAELSFFFFCVMYSCYGTFPTLYIDNPFLRWLLNIMMFVGYCGSTLQIGQWLEYEKRQADNEEEKVIETRYRNPN